MPQTRLGGLLLVEIGGTHTRCAISRDGGPPEATAGFDNADHPDLESVLAAYLETLDAPVPRRAGLAVAAPVHAQPLRLTNLGWTVDGDRLKKRFGWNTVALVNDFEALACAVPLLDRDELLVVQPGEAVPGAAVAVLGPGTGLGVSGLLSCGGRWAPISGEGGHVTLAAVDDRETEILGMLRRRHEHVSAERVLSGPGLLSLYRLLADRPAADSPRDVTRLAESGDPFAVESLALFFRFLGIVAGDLALTLGARGGVYLGGGILPGIRERLLKSDFGRRFVGKGRFAAYLQRVPVFLIVAEMPGLRGLARHPRVL